MKIIEQFREKYASGQADTIRRAVAAWAFDDAEELEEVVNELEKMDCAACYSPAPIYYHEMAGEIARHWPEIDEALDRYLENFGDVWTPNGGQSFLCYLWFAYEWMACELAGEIRGEMEASREED